MLQLTNGTRNSIVWSCRKPHHESFYIISIEDTHPDTYSFEYRENEMCCLYRSAGNSVSKIANVFAYSVLAPLALLFQPDEILLIQIVFTA